MALDGFVISNIVYELNQTILNAKISKIAQPENDELLFTCKGSNGQFRLAMSASASLPFLYLTGQNKPSPMTAPNFCMVLRKHIANGRIVKIYQPHMERIIQFDIEHLDEMGDLCRKTLIVELMGKHSNIIFCNSDGKIIDSIKHISSMMSSLREVLPGRDYCIPATQDDRLNPLEVTEEAFLDMVMKKPTSITKALYSSFTGLSPLLASEICHRSSIDGDMPVDSLDDDGIIPTNQTLFLKEKNRLIFPASSSHSFRTMRQKILIPSHRFWRNIMLPKMCIQESVRNPLI